jgi:hypothetical protein
MHRDDRLTRTERPAKRLAGITLLAIALTATPAHANPGTAMLWPVVFHFVVGNLLIGAAEWIGLCLFGASKLRAAVMIPANYLSGLAGIALARSVVPEAMLDGAGVLTNMTAALLISIAAFAIIGVLIELPFVAIAFKKPRRWGRIVLACLAVNTVTSTGLAWYYEAASDNTLARSFRVVPSAEISTPGPFWIYAIAPDTQQIERFRLDGSERSTAAELPRTPDGLHDIYMGFALSVSNVDAQSPSELIYHTGHANQPISPIEETTQESIDQPWSEDAESLWYTVVIPSIGTGATETESRDGPGWKWHAADLRPEAERVPTVKVTPHSPQRPVEIRFADDRRERLALINPLVSTSATPKSVTVLPGNLIVFELGGIESTGSRGVFIADLDGRTIAYLGPGRSPVVVVEPQPAP